MSELKAHEFIEHTLDGFKEPLKRHFKAVKDTTCNCLFCRNLNKKVNNENND